MTDSGMRCRFAIFFVALISSVILSAVPNGAWADEMSVTPESSETSTSALEDNETTSGHEERATSLSELPSLAYRSHISKRGWESCDCKNGEISGTTGQSLQIEALKVAVHGADDLGITYRAHVQNIGWQNWVSGGSIAGTTGKSLRVEAVELKLTGSISDAYDLYYRVHSSSFGWLDWAKNGEPAGSSGWGRAVEAIQIVIVKKGESAPGQTGNAFVPAYFKTTAGQIGETTTANIKLAELDYLKLHRLASSIRVKATMSYNGTVTRSLVFEQAISSITADGYSFDLKDYGPFELTVDFIKDGKVVHTEKQPLGISANEYNLAPLSASFPVVLYSLAYWDVSDAGNGSTIPSIVMLDRPKAYNWSSLPDGMHALPFMIESQNKSSANWQIFADYVKALYKLNPKAKFNLYINDITCSLVHRMIYANGIPQGQYSIRLLSDGSATYVYTNDTFDVDDPDSKQAGLIVSWNKAKAEEYKTGKVAKGYTGYHDHWDSMYALLSIEPGTEWWMTRTNLFKSGDNNAFANKIANDPAVKKKNVSGMLTDLKNRGDATVQAFKAMYNFNDGYFDAATSQGKKAMMLLGTYVYNEKNFEDYANLTEVYYGDKYLYYYKGHPNTPTGMYPEKRKQLERLNITDVDSSVAAELILFFNPEIGLSGYGSSTYNSTSKEMAGGLWGYRKAQALSPDSTIDYSIMDWFASPITNDTDATIRGLCKERDTCYLVEFSDEILDSANYDFAIYSHDSGALTFYKKKFGLFKKVSVKRGPLDVLATSHVAQKGWQSPAKSGGISGTVGESKAVEAFTLNLQNAPYDGSIEYRAHVAGTGWQPYVEESKTAGTTGKNKPIEAMQIRLTGDMAKKYDVYYRAHVQNLGWLDWAKNDEIAGTTGYGYRLEAFQVVLVEKGGTAPGAVTNHCKQKMISYRSHVSKLGWQGYTCDAGLSGTTGRSLAVEAINVKLNNSQYSGVVEYRSHVAKRGWQKWVKNGALSGTTGKSLPIEAIEIKLAGEIAQHYNVEYRAHVQNQGWQNWVKNGQIAGTTGRAHRVEAYEVRLVKK